MLTGSLSVTTEREQPAQRLGQHALALSGRSRALATGHGCGPGLHHALEGALLVRGVALDRLDEVRDQVVATLELNVDLAPCLLHEVAQLDEAVVHADRPEGEQHDDGDDDELEHVFSPR